MARLLSSLSLPRLPSILLLGLMIGAAVVTSLRGTLSAGIPGRQSIDAVRPWMADCLVGIGPKRRDEVAQQLRAGRWEQIPLRARARAGQFFAEAPESWSSQHH